MMAQGYQPSEVVLPTFIPAAAYQLGAPDNFGSPLATVRRWLSERGMI